ncbi:MAG: TVP38/TMEM64 family protein [Alphaproteobacteria bacterium]|nr:TVP38/TMEM64 family protein [Alphaproteobacteria bacterium]MBL6953328.1 TVP38/TMEM64 family protein [Alphaproteobacteria bacterium]
MGGQNQGKRDDNAAARAPLLSMRRLWPLLVLAAGLIAFLAAGGDEYLSLDSLRLYRADLAKYVADHAVVMALCFLAAYAVMVAFSLPGALLMTVTGGFFFGSILATGLVVLGATIGATAVFLIAKTALGDPLRTRAGPALLKMEDGFRENAFNYLLILRLIPLFPFFLVNLVPAFLGVRLRDYVLATFIGIIPGTFVFAQVGTGLDSILDSDEELSVGSLMSNDVLAALLGLAVLSALPLLYKFIRARGQGKGTAR